MQNWTRRMVSVVAIAVLGAACSSPADEQVEALDNTLEQVERLGSEVDADELPDDERECVLSSWAEMDFGLVVGAIGPEADAARADVQNGVLDCVDDLSDFPSYVSVFANNVSTGVGNGVDLSDAEGLCTLEVIQRESSDPGYTIAVGDRQEDIDAFFIAVSECFTPENQALATGTLTGADEYGSSEQLDVLYDDCAGGDLIACDVLWSRSTVDSGYEAFALTCGGGGEAVPSCSGFVDLITIGSGDSYVGDGEQQLTDECAGGLMTACDLLFIYSPLGSTSEDIGTSCNGRIPIGAIPDCRTALGARVEPN